MNVVKKKLVALYERYYEVKMKFDDHRARKRLGTPRIMSIDDTLDYIIEHKCSIARFGDGEFKLICGDNIKFQGANNQLSLRLREVITSNTNECLICLPDSFGSLRWMVPKAYNYMWRIVCENREKWMSVVEVNRNYGNAYLSRCYIDWKDKSKSKQWFEQAKKIWEQQEIVFIEGEKSRLGVGNDLFANAKSVHRILCPSENAFSYYDSILETATQLDKKKLILLALGPTASVLAYDLSRLGYRALDVGHIDIEYEWFLRKATEKVRIEYKFTNEAVGGDVVEELFDGEWASQVIARVGC